MSKNNKNKIIWLLSLGLVGAGIFLVYQLANGPAVINVGKDSEENPASVLLAVKENDWFKGGKNAKAVLIEYSDFQCPACKAYAPVLEQLNQEFGDNLKIVYRHFPLFQIHANAILAAEASEAAGQEGKFWEMHDKIFEGQAEWASSSGAKEIFKNYALSLGIDEEKFLANLDSKEVRERVANDLKEAQTLGFNYTPTFIFNGQKIENPRSYDEFASLVREAVAQ